MAPGEAVIITGKGVFSNLATHRKEKSWSLGVKSVKSLRHRQAYTIQKGLIKHIKRSGAGTVPVSICMQECMYMKIHSMCCTRIILFSRDDVRVHIQALWCVTPFSLEGGVNGLLSLRESMVFTHSVSHWSSVTQGVNGLQSLRESMVFSHSGSQWNSVTQWVNGLQLLRESMVFSHSGSQ